MNHYPEKIYDLLESSSFENLNSSDCEFILEHMTESEYKQMYALWNKVQYEQEKETKPNEQVWNNLQAQFEKQHKPRVVPLWKERIPLYKAAAAVLIPVLATILYYEQFRMKNNTEEVLSVVDTVFVKGATDTVFIKETPQKMLEPKVIRIIQTERVETETLRGSIPLSADSTYLELTSNLKSSKS